jgi:hypothetical protein
MKRFWTIVFCLAVFSATASHIVGGEFEIIHLVNFDYQFNLIIYFDEVNGLQGNKTQDKFITARIYRVSDNAFMRDVPLAFTEINDVHYTQAKCSIEQLKTSRMFYTSVSPITLPAGQYNDPQGYYIIWERCCRNYTIANIHSRNPNEFPGEAAGQTFYLQFPPVVKDGKPFVNSSPELFPPLSDYACINKPYYADFAGHDRDGDSLAYTLVTPLSTHTSDAYPPLNPAPYPPVRWQSSFNLSHIMNGNPDLQISADGLLTVRPSFITGLFVFAVKCEEYRHGIKIGEVRRDFQMLVQDCKDADPPKITAKTPDGGLKDNTLNLSYQNTVADADRCITVHVADSDAFKISENFKEVVSIRAIPIGFKGDVSEVLVGEITGNLSPLNQSIEFPICFKKCAYKEEGFKIGIIAYDDACSLPLLDTLILNVYIEPPHNERARLSADIVDTIVEGKTKVWTIEGSDAEHDALTASFLPIGFDPKDIGLTYEQVITDDGYEGKITWAPDCHKYDFNIGTNFKAKVLLDDADECGFNEPDTLELDLSVILEDNQKPQLAIKPVNVLSGVDANIFETINFTAFGNDPDNDHLSLKMVTEDFNATDVGAAFTDVEAATSVSSPFSWVLACDKIDVASKSDFEFLFLLTETTKKCNIHTTDTLAVDIHVDKPDNRAPDLNVSSLTVPIENDALNITLGQQVSLLLNSKDADNHPVDHLKIELIDAEGTVPPEGYQFTPAEGEGEIQTTFTWAPDCGIFVNDIYKNDYVFKFRTTDDRCQNAKADTVLLNVSIKDVDAATGEFVPPNIITPNDDGCNDYFALEGFDPEHAASECGVFVNPNLPNDNCTGRFASIRIYNRWGKEVFTSTQRNFRWTAENEAAGVYFYTIVYSHPENKNHQSEFKGTITVRF